LEDIGVIILNFNTSQLTIDCVNSIFNNSPKELIFRIIIVDNNSREEEFNKLDSLRSNERVIIFRNPQNAGFSGGNMEGVRLCSPEYYFFLNNDTLLLNDNLSILYRFMQDHPGAGICSGQLYNENHKPGINFNYIPDLKLKLLGSGLLRLFDKANYPVKGKEYNEPIRVPVLNGSSLFVRAVAFDQAGGFDTNFFLYCEEEDLAIRMKKSGYKLYLVPEAKYMHLQGGSSTKDPVKDFKYLKEFYISQHYLYRKHFGTAAMYVWRLTQFFRSVRKFYKNRNYLKLAVMLLRGPSIKESMRNIMHK